MPFDGSKLDDVTKLLIEGRERIEQGWCQHSYRIEGAVCAIGAIRYYDCRSVQRPLAIATYSRLHRAIGRRWPGVPEWNDAPGRTKNEVLEAFDRAIALG